METELFALYQEIMQKTQAIEAERKNADFPYNQRLLDQMLACSHAIAIYNAKCAETSWPQLEDSYAKHIQQHANIGLKPHELSEVRAYPQLTSRKRKEPDSEVEQQGALKKPEQPRLPWPR